MAQTLPAPNDPDLVALLSARDQAESLVVQGDHVGAATVLTYSLRNCPPNRPGLADAAYGNGQMVSYVLLHVMPEADAYDFLLNQIDPDTYVTDKMVKLLCYIASGLNEAQKTELSQQITYLTSSENDIVRIITRFYLSNPYFYDNDDFTNQYAAMLGDEFPTLELTQVSLNLALYKSVQKGGVDGLLASMDNDKSATAPYQPCSQRLRERLHASAEGLSKQSTYSRSAALTPLIEGIEKGESWQERHFSLMLMKGELTGEAGPALQGAIRALAQRQENTPDVLQARVLLAKTLSTVENDTDAHEESLTLARTLLDTGVGVTTPERVMWETRAYGIQGCAENMVKSGHIVDAIEIYEALADQLPGSKFADACKEAVSKLFYHKPLTAENAAE